MDFEMTEDNSCEKLILKAALSEAASPAGGKEPESPYGEVEGAPVLTVRSVLQQGQSCTAFASSPNQTPENGPENQGRQDFPSTERNTDCSDDFDIVIEPAFEEVRKKLPQTFSVYLYNNGVQLDDEITWGYSGLSQEYFSLVQDDHEFTLSVNQFANNPLTLTFSAEVATKTIDIWLKPLF